MENATQFIQSRVAKSSVAAFFFVVLLIGCPHVHRAPWPGSANAYSWDGSWTPGADSFPLNGLHDDTYNDGHLVGGNPSPVLPPGRWDWPCAEEVCALASWKSFSEEIGTFDALIDRHSRAFGWRLVANEYPATVLDSRVELFEGSFGTDVLDCGNEGRIEHSGGLTLGDGPDVIRYRTCEAADWRTGSSETAHAHDNDLVIAGGDTALDAGDYDVTASTVHTGPGRDLVFVNNIARAAVDLGNGVGGRTDALDADDDGDIAVLGGNFDDVRLFGGNGDDVFIWRVDEINMASGYVTGNFFGGGGWNPGVWDEGVDRLVLDVPLDTPLLPHTPGAELAQGSATLNLFDEYSEEPVPDGLMQDDPLTRYYVYAGIGPEGQKTLTLRYRSASDHVRALVMLTAIEEIQIGIGENARVYKVDQVNGKAEPSASLKPVTEILQRGTYANLIESFGESLADGKK